MKIPTLQRGEQWRVQSPGVYVRSSLFNAFLTNRRIILTSYNDPRIPDKDLYIDRIEGIEVSANDAGEPLLAICVKTSRSGNRRLVLTFSEQHGTPSRMGEREEWIRHLSLVLKNPAKLELSGNLHGAPQKNRPAALPGDGSFFCTTCGNRVRSNSLYCDRCGGKVCPPKPELPKSYRYPPQYSENYNDREDGGGDTNLHSNQKNGFGYTPRGQITMAFDALPPRNSPLDSNKNNDGTPQPPSRTPREPFSVLGLFKRKSSKREARGTARQPVKMQAASRVRRYRLALSVAIIVLMVCVAAGILMFVSPEGFPSIMEGISPAVIGNATTTSPATTEGTNEQDAVLPVSPEGVNVRVEYSGPWSGLLSMTDTMQEVSGSGEQVLPVAKNGDSVTVMIRKDDDSSSKLIVELYRDGELIATGDTIKPGGTVAITGSL